MILYRIRGPRGDFDAYGDVRGRLVRVLSGANYRRHHYDALLGALEAVSEYLKEGD